MSAIAPLSPVRLLDRVLTGLTYSTAGYILTSNPYTTKKDDKTFALLGEIAKSDAELAVECIGVIEELDAFPQIGAPHPNLASLNYLSFPFLLEAQIEDHRRWTGGLEKMIAAANDAPRAAREMLEKVLERKRAELEKLEGHLAANYKPEEASA